MFRRTALVLGVMLLAAAELQAFQGPQSAVPGVENELLDSTLSYPVALAMAPSGKLFIAEKAGLIKLYKPGGNKVSIYATVSPVYGPYESGLLGLCLDPDFSTNGYLYVFVTRTQSLQQIVRYTTTGDTGSDPTVIVDNIPSVTGYHNGGGIGFGPDGFLYAVVGENNQHWDAQVAASWRGKVLRFDVSTTPASIPDSNPTAGSAVYSIGHRHPFRLTFRPGTGALYVSENGPSIEDEINVITPGANYGWPADWGPNVSSAYTDPVLTLTATDTVAITDLLFYTGKAFPYAGHLFYAEFKTNKIRRVEMNPSSEQVASGPTDFVTGISGPVDIEQGPDGFLYYCSYYQGRLYRARTTTPTPPAIPFTVVQVSPEPDQQLSAGPAAVTLLFNRTINPFTVTKSTFLVIRAGPDGSFDTADDVAIVPASVSMKVNTVTLDLAGADLPPDQYRIKVRGNDGPPPSPHAGLFAHWKLDEGTGPSAADSSGNARHGGLSGPEWAPGIYGGALRFGGDGDRVDIDAGVLGPQWTATMWVNKSWYVWMGQCLMDANDPDSNTSLRLAQVAGNDVGLTEYSVVDYGSGYVVPIGVWTHLAFTSDGTNARIYVNGVLASTAPRPFDLTVDKLGTAYDGRADSLAGLLDEVQVYGRVLTESEIASLALYSGRVRSEAGVTLDGDFTGPFPAGDGAEGGDFVSTFRILAPPVPPGPDDPVAPTGGDDSDHGCGLLGAEAPLFLAAIWLFRRRRTLK